MMRFHTSQGAPRVTAIYFRAQEGKSIYVKSHITFFYGRLNTRCLFTARKAKSYGKMWSRSRSTLVTFISAVFGGSLTYVLYKYQPQSLPPTPLWSELQTERERKQTVEERKEQSTTEIAENSTLSYHADKQVSRATDSSWGSFTASFLLLSSITDSQWTGNFVNFIMPEWAKFLPEHIKKLQKEFSMAPGSLAHEIWQEAHDPYLNPEIKFSASVRISTDLCDEEKEFLRNKRRKTVGALAKYVGIPVQEIHPDDVPIIAMVGSGGGLRALVAGTGSMLATKKVGLFDCVTYTAGVSGSCWLQCLYHSSLGGQSFEQMVNHLKARIGIHIAYPPVALSALNFAPTNKYLLSGFIEKLKGDPESDFGLVDVYGILLAARLLVPKGEVGIDDADLKLSNQRRNLIHGEHPMPIYTAVRHQIPILEESFQPERATDNPSEEKKANAKKEAWFQWFEISPFEMFCEEFGSGIPTWAIGRKFENGKDLAHEETSLRIPELRLPLLLGIFGSAFCATLSHYYKEIKPLVRGLTGFTKVEEIIEGRDEDLSRVHPITPASIPNFAYKMDGKLPDTVPEEIFKDSHLQLMDAGMSNNLPVYPLLRPGRNVDILIVFDASADVKVENWLSVADGYARQRGIKGWPVGAGWPRPSESAAKTAGQIDAAQANTTAEVSQKVEDAKNDQVEHLKDVKQRGSQVSNSQDPEDAGDLGYCTIWVGRTEERSAATDEVKSKVVDEDWELMQPDAGISVIYFPFLSNAKVEGVDPARSDFMSTWNFVYTPEDVDKVVALAGANFEEGQERTRRCVRAVYERKKKAREVREEAQRQQRWRRKVRLGMVNK